MLFCAGEDSNAFKAWSKTRGREKRGITWCWSILLQCIHRAVSKPQWLMIISGLRQNWESHGIPIVSHHSNGRNFQWICNRRRSRRSRYTSTTQWLIRHHLRQRSQRPRIFPVGIWLAKADGAVNSCVATAPGQVKSSKTETADFSSLFD